MQLKIIQIALGWKREKIFPRSVQLDKIKTQNTDSYKQAWTEMGGRRETQHLYKISKLLFWGLGMPILPCCTPFDLREALLCSLTCALPICPLTIQTPIMAREAHPQYMAVPPCMTKWPVQQKHAPCVIHLHHSNLSAGMLHDRLPSSLRDTSIPCITEHVSSMDIGYVDNPNLTFYRLETDHRLLELLH